MLPSSLRHPSVILCALACTAATGMLAMRAFGPRPVTALQASEHFLSDPLPAPTLNLIDAQGKPVTLATLKGKVWLCDFFLTRCTSICPALTTRFVTLGNAFDKDSKKYATVRLLSIAVDPGHDTPALLQEHRKKLGLNADSRWVHATSTDEKAVWAMIQNDFKLFVGPSKNDPTTPVAHSDKIVLLDTQGRIRGYYGGRDEVQVKALKNDLDYLLSHPE